jgi:hypothetical protein
VIDTGRRPLRLGVGLLTAARELVPDATAWAAGWEPLVRTWQGLTSADGYEALAIAWPVDAAIDLHDHGDSAGAVVVVSGSLVETVVGHDDDGSLVASPRWMCAGDHVTFPAGHVHDIVNHGPGPAVSVHVYSPVLRSMTFFEPRDGSVLVAVRTEEYATDVVGR